MKKKNQDIAAERFVDLLADYGVDDHTLTQVIGSDATLDGAINYFLDVDEERCDQPTVANTAINPPGNNNMTPGSFQNQIYLKLETKGSLVED